MGIEAGKNYRTIKATALTPAGTEVKAMKATKDGPHHKAGEVERGQLNADQVLCQPKGNPGALYFAEGNLETA